MIYQQHSVVEDVPAMTETTLPAAGLSSFYCSVEEAAAEMVSAASEAAMIAAASSGFFYFFAAVAEIMANAVLAANFLFKKRGYCPSFSLYSSV